MKRHERSSLNSFFMVNFISEKIFNEAIREKCKISNDLSKLLLHFYHNYQCSKE